MAEDGRNRVRCTQTLHRLCKGEVKLCFVCCVLSGNQFVTKEFRAFLAFKRFLSLVALSPVVLGKSLREMIFLALREGAQPKNQS